MAALQDRHTLQKALPACQHHAKTLSGIVRGLSHGKRTLVLVATRGCRRLAHMKLAAHALRLQVIAANIPGSEHTQMTCTTPEAVAAWRSALLDAVNMAGVRGLRALLLVSEEIVASGVATHDINALFSGRPVRFTLCTSFLATLCVRVCICAFCACQPIMLCWSVSGMPRCAPRS